MKRGSHKIIILLLFFILNFTNLHALPIEGKGVDIQILDKITSKISNIYIKVNDNYNHETLKIEIHACYKRPPEEVPEDFVLLRIFDIDNKKNSNKIFQGWMISSSPSTSPLEHPIYDLWIKDCKI